MGLKKGGARKAHGGVRLSKLPVSAGATTTAKHTERQHQHVVQELDPVFAYSEIPDEVLVGTELDLSVSDDKLRHLCGSMLLCFNADRLCIYTHVSMGASCCCFL